MVLPRLPWRNLPAWTLRGKSRRSAGRRSAGRRKSPCHAPALRLAALTMQPAQKTPPVTARAAFEPAASVAPHPHLWYLYGSGCSCHDAGFGSDIYVSRQEEKSGASVRFGIKCDPNRCTDQHTHTHTHTKTEIKAEVRHADMSPATHAHTHAYGRQALTQLTEALPHVRLPAAHIRRDAPVYLAK